MRLVLAGIYKKRRKRVLRTQLGYNLFFWGGGNTTRYPNQILIEIGNGESPKNFTGLHIRHPLQESKNHCSTLTRRIAGIGSKGRYPGNCERDLFRVLNLPLETWCTNLPVLIFRIC